MVKTQSIPLSKIAEETSNRFDVDYLSFQAISEKKGYAEFASFFNVIEKEKGLAVPSQLDYCEIGNVEKTGDIRPVILDEEYRNE